MVKDKRKNIISLEEHKRKKEMFNLQEESYVDEMVEQIVMEQEKHIDDLIKNITTKNKKK